MAKVIVSTGRGGVGKSTFAALATKYLSAPKLLIDLDPDESLADMLGVDLEQSDTTSISSLLYEVAGASSRVGYEELSRKMESALQGRCLYSAPDFDLITLGTKFTVGCYCAPDTVLKDTLPRLLENYEHVLIDSPAGLEHLNRKVVSDITDLFILIDPSDKSAKHVSRVQDIAGALDITYRNLYVVGNYRFTEETEKDMTGLDGTYLGRVHYDAELKRYNLEGRSLLELSDESPAVLSVKRILQRAGYARSQ
ncbi:MAG: AAA family ATPase [Chloroflexota bacterium]